jgi:hypothetical protein
VNGAPAVVESLGWAATAVFVGSYFTHAALLKRVQMVGALMWVGYGLLTHAWPVVAANLMVFGAAAWTAKRGSPEGEGNAQGLVEGPEPGDLLARGDGPCTGPPSSNVSLVAENA